MRREWEPTWHDIATMTMLDVNDLLEEWRNDPVLLTLGVSRQMRRIPMRCQRYQELVCGYALLKYVCMHWRLVCAVSSITGGLIIHELDCW